MDFLLLLSFFITTFTLIFFFHFYPCSSRRHPDLPPGNLGIPFLGETLRLISLYKSSNPEPFIDSRVLLFGRVFTTHIFGELTVFSADVDFNRIVLNDARSFHVSYPSSISTLLGKNSLLIMSNPLHKRMHSLTMSRFANATDFLNDIERMVRINLSRWTDGQVIRLLDQTKRITFGITVKQIMSCEDEEWTEKLRREYVMLIDGFFSIFTFLPFTTYARAVKARGKVAEMLRGALRERRDGSDMLADLIKEEMAEEEIVDFLLALLVAGYETTPTIMTLAVKFLTENPRALSVLKEEHENIRAKKQESEALDWGDYKAMHFTQCVISETLRVANIISGVFRRAATDISYKGYTIPKGCKVFASFRGVHLDTDNFKDARTFNPWRWQSASKENGVFTPFGGGPRLCPGYELARVEISLFLHYLVTSFSWDVAEEDKLVFFPTTRILKGYPIIVRRHGVHVFMML